MSIRIGALGCSTIARRRALPTLRSVPHARLTAVASRSPEQAKRFAAEFDVAARGYDDLIEAEDIDAVYISVPTGQHHEWAARALRAGKHVLCEKPMAVTAARAEELTGLAADRNLVLRENFTSGHHPQHEHVRQLLAAGRIGAPRTLSAAFCIPPLAANDIRYDRGLGGGALLDVGFYPLRIAGLLLGPDLTVAGATLRIDARLGVDLAGTVTLVSADGVFAVLEFGMQHGYRSRYSVWGSTGGLTLDRAFTPPPAWQPVLHIEEQDHAEQICLPAADQWLRCIGSFVDATLTGWDPTTEAGQLAPVVRNAALVDAVLATAVRVPVPEGETR